MNQKAQQAAEEQYKKISVMRKVWTWKEGFLAGVEWLKKELLEGKDEFDKKPSTLEYVRQLREFPRRPLEPSFMFEEGARWQWKQDQLVIQALRERAMCCPCCGEEVSIDQKIKMSHDVSKYVLKIQQLEAEIERPKSKGLRNN